MAATFSVRIVNRETGEEQRTAATHTEPEARRLAEREAERLVAMLDRKRLVRNLRARFEPDHSAGAGDRWLVWEPTEESSGTVAYIVTVLRGDENPDE